MEFRILGPLTVVDGDRELPLGPGKERAVLGLLLLHAGAVVSRTQLIDGLWGEAPPPTADKALTVYVSQVRKTLTGNGVTIATRPPGYALAVAPEAVDAARFERLTEAARERAAAGELEAAAALMREALALWRGRPLAGVDLDGAALDDLARLEELRLAAERDLIDYELALGRHEQLVAELELLVAQHPVDERLRGQLILALYRSGRQADALQAYRETRATLVDELGLEPSAPLQRLEMAILNQDPSLEVPAGVARIRRRPRSRARILVAAAVSAAALAVAVAFLAGAFRGAREPAVVANSLVRLDSGGRRVAAVTPVGQLPTRAAVTDDAAWVLSGRNGTVSRVDADSGAVTSVAVPGAPQDVAAGQGAVWVASRTDGAAAVVRIDQRTAEVQSTTQIKGVHPRGLAAGQGSVWLAGENGRGSGGVLVRISAATNSVTQSLPLPSKPSGVEVGPQDVWVTGQLLASPTRTSTAGAVYVVDPSSGQIVARGRAPFEPLRGRTSLAVGAGAAWIAGTNGAVVRIDAQTARVTAVVHTPLAADAVAVSGGDVWVAADGGALYRLDPQTGAVIERAVPSRGALRPFDLVAGSGHLWLTMGPAQALRTRPLVVKGTLQALAVPAPGPGRIRFGAGFVWATGVAGNMLFRLDPRGGAMATTRAGGGAGDIGFGAGSVWAADFHENVVDRVDPRTNRVLARIPTQGAAPIGVAYADGAIWVANHHAGPEPSEPTGSVVRIDPRRNRVVARIPLGAHEYCCGPDNMVAAFGSLWVDIPNQQLVVRIDPQRTRVVARIHVPSGCGQLTAGAGALWVADGCSSTLLRIDPRTNRIVARVDTNGSPAYPIDWHDGSIWTTTADLRLLRVDPKTNSVVSTTDVAPTTRPQGEGPFFVFGGGWLWISDFGGGRVLRVAVPAG